MVEQRAIPSSTTDRPLRCLVTGATGYVGGRLVPELLAAGHRVRVMTRSPERLRDHPWAGQVEIARADATTAEFQEMITRYAWGEIWTRDGLPRHTRSLLTIAMMVALNRSEELALHLRAAKNNGVSRDQIKEVLMQTAIYCGIPAALDSFRAAQEVFDEQDAAK